MFGRKLKQKIKELEEKVKFLTIDRNGIEGAAKNQAERYKQDLGRMDELKAENTDLKKKVEELKMKISRKEQKRGADGRFAKKDPQFEPEDGEIISVDFDNSTLTAILKGKMVEGLNYAYALIGDDEVLSSFIAFGFWSGNSIRPATGDEKKRLFNALKEKGLKWNDETKTLDKVDNLDTYVDGAFRDGVINIE